LALGTELGGKRGGEKHGGKRRERRVPNLAISLHIRTAQENAEDEPSAAKTHMGAMALQRYLRKQKTKRGK